MSTDLPPRGRSARYLPWAVWLLVLAGAWMAHEKAARHRTAREVADRYTAALGEVAIDEAAFLIDATLELGIVSRHDNDARGAYRLPEQMGPGVGLFDFDADGDLDIFVAGGGSLSSERPAQLAELWRNDGGHFSEVAREVGAAVAGPSYGVACADYDGDGDVDVYVTRLGADVLLRNEGGRFVDATAEAGLGQTGFGTSAAFFDYDQDGALDLYVANYIDWSAEREHECFYSGGRDYCQPASYHAPAQDRLYRGRGDGSFEDVTESAGIDGQRRSGLGVIAADFDGDGWTDLYVANDETPALLWRNDGEGGFEEAALRMGCACDRSGVAIAGMGVACEDLNADGLPDLFVTNIRGQGHLVFFNEGERLVDTTLRSGVLGWSLRSTGFGVVLFDQDHDGRWDVYVTNGAVNLDPERVGAPQPYDQPDQFARLVDGRFALASKGRGGIGRGLASGDLDGDGDLDLVVTNNGGNLQVLENRQDGSGAWLLVDVRTAAGSPALGALVTARTSERTQRRTVRAQSSYLSSSDPRAHFGLGAAESVDELVVTWPDGTQTRRTDVPARQVLVVTHE